MRKDTLTYCPQPPQSTTQPGHNSATLEHRHPAHLPDEVWRDVLLPCLPCYMLSVTIQLNARFLTLSTSHLWATEQRNKREQLTKRLQFRFYQLANHQSLPITNRYHQSLIQTLPAPLGKHHFAGHTTPKMYWGLLYQYIAGEIPKSNTDALAMIKIMTAKLYGHQIHEIGTIVDYRFTQRLSRLYATGTSEPTAYYTESNAPAKSKLQTPAGSYIQLWHPVQTTCQALTNKKINLDTLTAFINEMPAINQAQLINELIATYLRDHSPFSARTLRPLSHCSTSLIRSSPWANTFFNVISCLDSASYQQTLSCKAFNQMAYKAIFMCHHIGQATPLERKKVVEGLLSWITCNHSGLQRLGWHYLYRISPYITMKRQYNATFRLCYRMLGQPQALWSNHVDAMKLLHALQFTLPANYRQQFYATLKQIAYQRGLSLLAHSHAALLLLQAEQPVDNALLLTLISKLSSTREPSQQQHIKDLKDFVLLAPPPLDQQALSALLAVTHVSDQDPLAVQAVLEQLTELKQLKLKGYEPNIDFQQIMYQFFEQPPVTLFQNPPLDHPTCERIFWLFAEFDEFWQYYVNNMANCIKQPRLNLTNILIQQHWNDKHATWHHHHPSDHHSLTAINIQSPSPTRHKPAKP